MRLFDLQMTPKEIERAVTLGWGSALLCSVGSLLVAFMLPGFGVPRRAPPSMKWLPIGKFPTQRRARSPSYARRARASVPSAPSNMRLELTGAACCGRIAVVRHPTPETSGRRRARARCARSSSAIR